MAFKRSAITHGSTGVKSFVCGFQPEEAELIVRPAPGAVITDVYLSTGTTDGTNQNCDTFTVYSARRRQETFTDRMASIWEWNGASWTEVFKITFDSFTATEFKYNVVIGNPNYQVLRLARG